MVAAVLYELTYNDGASLYILVRVCIERRTSGTPVSAGGWCWGVARTAGSSVVISYTIGDLTSLSKASGVRSSCGTLSTLVVVPLHHHQGQLQSHSWC